MQTGQRATVATERKEASAEEEEEKALRGGGEKDEGVFPSKEEKGFNPALIIEADDEIEKVFEKFIFSVRRFLSPL